MQRYILKRHIDRYAPGADITDAYPAEDLAKWAREGIVRVAAVADPPLTLDELTPNPVEPATAPVGEPVEVKPVRKRK